MVTEPPDPSKTSATDGAGPRLFAAFLGGPLSEGRMGEDHEVVFVVAEDPAAAKGGAKQKWHGSGRCHVDAVREITAVDGYQVDLRRVGGGDRTTLDDFN